MTTSHDRSDERHHKSQARADAPPVQKPGRTEASAGDRANAEQREQSKRRLEGLRDDAQD